MRVDERSLVSSFKVLSKKTQAFTGIVYRVVHEGLVTNYGVDSIISGRGPKEFQSGRWMTKGICYVLYTSFSIAVAIKEVVRKTQEENDRFVLARLHVSLSRVLDLTNVNNLNLLDLKKEDLISAYSFDEKKESYTQLIGRYAYESGLDGIKVPSAVNTDEANLVVFSDETPIVGVSMKEWEIFKA